MSVVCVYVLLGFITMFFMLLFAELQGLLCHLAECDVFVSARVYISAYVLFLIHLDCAVHLLFLCCSGGFSPNIVPTAVPPNQRRPVALPLPLPNNPLPPLIPALALVPAPLIDDGIPDFLELEHRLLANN